MTLLREIQNEAASSTSSVPGLLRKTMILAARLNSPELREWAMRELDGYSDDQELPGYRIVGGLQSYGHFAGPFGAQIKNAPIPETCLPVEFREVLPSVQIRFGVAVIEDHIAKATSGSLQLQWPSELVHLMAGGRITVYENMECLSAWRVLSVGSFVRILDAVRTKLLAFALEIEQKNPEAGESADSGAPLPPSTVAQVFHQNFYGTTGNIAVGGTGFTQMAWIESGDRGALVDALDQFISECRESSPDIANAAELARKEAKKRSPNPVTLAGLLAAIGGSVQTLAAAPEAYRLLKAAALTFGIHLP
jgi:AbiTii